MYRGVRSGRRVSFILELHTCTVWWLVGAYFSCCLQLLQTLVLLQFWAISFPWTNGMEFGLHVSLVYIWTLKFNSCTRHAVWLKFFRFWIWTPLFVGLTCWEVKGEVRWSFLMFCTIQNQHVSDNTHTVILCVPVWACWSSSLLCVFGFSVVLGLIF